MSDSKELVCSDRKETYDPTGNPDQELEFNKGPPNQNNSEPLRNPRNPYKGVYLKRGLEKWTSEIRDPFTGRRFYLGLFTSAEAALEAYCAKKLEIDNKHAKDASISQFHLPNEQLEVNQHRKNTYKGVCLRKTGKWTAMINDPYTHVPLFLGTFATEEAANEAYCASKLDQKRAASNESCGRGKRERKPVSQSEFESPKKKPRINSGDVPYKGVRKTPAGKFDAAIWDPVSKSKCYLGLFDSAEAAHSVYCAKKLKIDLKITKFSKSCKKPETGENNKKKKRGTKQKSEEAVVSSVSSKCSLLEECRPCLEKTGDFERKSDFFPVIVDENGFLLGEFNQIDDLAICD